MITFEPDAPWTVGQRVTLHHGDYDEVKVVESVLNVIETIETAGGHKTEAQYTLISERAWQLRQQGIRPYIELDS